MEQEDKELLLKDICSRLPYRVKCKYYDCCEGDYDDGTICGFERKEYIQIDGVCIHIEEVKPYLFPLESMSEEQKEEYQDLLDNQYSFDANGNIFTLQDFYCKYHLDYRGMIPMGLAIDATKLNVY